MPIVYEIDPLCRHFFGVRILALEPTQFELINFTLAGAQIVKLVAFVSGCSTGTIIII